jgi:cell division protein ZapA (FtsZ GTPase activity inhibitor)
MINALRYTKILQENGFSKEQASIALEVGLDIMHDKLCTKEDLKFTEQRLDYKIDQVELRLDNKIDQVEQRLDNKIDQVEQRLNAKIDNLEITLRKDMTKMESSLRSEIKDITLKLGSLMIILFGMGLSILKFT